VQLRQFPRSSGYKEDPATGIAAAALAASLHFSNNNSGGNRKVQDELRTISDETQLLQTECEELLKRLFDHDNNKDIGTVLDESEVQEGRKLTAQLQYWYRLKCILKEEMDI